VHPKDGANWPIHRPGASSPLLSLSAKHTGDEGRIRESTVKGSDRQAPDLVERNFTAERPNLLWVADITYIPTWAGFLYLAVVLDACSRRIVGWSMATTLATRLVVDALNTALAMRRPKGVIHRSLPLSDRFVSAEICNVD
jgi:transposase InsO family protein